MPQEPDRRSFLKLALAGGLAAGLSACGDPESLATWLQNPASAGLSGLPEEIPNPRAASESTMNRSHADNLWPMEINLASNFMVDNPPRAAKDPATVETWNEIPLQRLTGRDFYGSLTTPLDQLTWELFTPGHTYLLSYYVRSAGPDPRVFFWMRPLSQLDTFGHAPKLATPEVRRVWELGYAPASNQLDLVRDPAQALGAGGDSRLHWFFQGHSNNGWQVDLRLGGFMVEDLGPLADGGPPRSGVAVIGDSTTMGYSQVQDHPLSREWTTYAAAGLNVPFYNRAQNGWTTADMRAAWDERITPLAPRCRFCIIQGGLNDIALSFSLEQMQENYRWMWDRAEEQGMLPIVATTTPYNVIAAYGGEGTRQALNEWIRGEFVRSLDFDAVVRDPGDPSSLRRQADWFGDGGHYEGEAKRAIGEYVAAWDGWDFPTPGPYQA